MAAWLDEGQGRIAGGYHHIMGIDCIPFLIFGKAHGSQRVEEQIIRIIIAISPHKFPVIQVTGLFYIERQGFDLVIHAAGKV